MGDNLLTGRGLGPEGILFIQNLASEAHSPLPKLECFEDSRGWCKIDRSFKIWNNELNTIDTKQLIKVYFIFRHVILDD